jgi:2-hydroxy-3-keto-5-methylthiopentenyl-1-phosphate phosphatase
MQGALSTYFYIYKYLVTIKYKDVCYNLLNYCVPENQNFIILESLNSIKENQYPLSVHILMFVDEGNYLMGRGHESDVRIADISVSRTHAKIFMKDNKFYLEDMGSKFGTLVLAKEEIPILKSNKILQIGRTLVNITDLGKSENLFTENKKFINFLQEDKLDYLENEFLEESDKDL